MLYEYASIAFAHLLKAEDEVSRSVSTEGGTIYLGTTITALYDYLFEVLNDFRKIHPKVKFKITTGSSDKTIEKLKNGIVDLSFVTTPFKSDKEFSTLKIKKFNDILIAGDRYSELKDRTLKLEDLENFPLICLEEGMQLREFIDQIFAENNLNFAPEIEPDSAHLIVQMVGTISGWALCRRVWHKRRLGAAKCLKLTLKMNCHRDTSALSPTPTTL